MKRKKKKRRRCISSRAVCLCNPSLCFVPDSLWRMERGNGETSSFTLTLSISKIWSSRTENILSRAGRTCTPLNFNGHVSARESLRSGTLGCAKTVHVTLHMQDTRTAVSNRDTKWQPSLWNAMLNKQRHYDFLAANVYRLVCVTKRWFSACRLKVLHTPAVQTHEAKTTILSKKKKIQNISEPSQLLQTCVSYVGWWQGQLVSGSHRVCSSVFAAGHVSVLRVCAASQQCGQPMHHRHAVLSPAPTCLKAL